MGQIKDLLDQIARLDQEASSAPWFAHPDAKYVYGYDAGAILDRCWDDQPDADIHFAALARTALPALSKAVRAVLKECQEAQDRFDSTPYDQDREGQARLAEIIETTITDAMKVAGND